MATPKEHIEEIRRRRFSIGGEPNPLIEDLHQAVNYLSAELYTKDVHFLMELIQNAEDNEYPESVVPSLEFVVTSRDVTGTGAPATLLVFNNEKGFSPKNVESICSVGRSSKKGLRKRGFIGEKGIGFKSVFLITSQPYIFSNGYHIRFNEEPCVYCNLGYIVPEWVEQNSITTAIKQIYGTEDDLPATTLVLPLKHDKVNSVKEQLSSIHPEVLLFLLKIKCLSVREDNEDPRLNSVKEISISKETNFVMRKNIDAESYVLHLCTDENSDTSECGYHMWRQRFPVRQENKVERRIEVEEWVIMLAFPFGKRLNRGRNSPGIYAFLPTEMVTNFPFIIQADFLLASSRETILLDNRWNQGILDCVPTAFVNAFTSLVKGVENAPVSSLPHMFGFLPVSNSLYEQLNVVRDSIKEKLMSERIIPCESYVTQKFFQKPSEVGRLIPTFWNLLHKARDGGESLHNISSHGKHIISSSFDQDKYDPILNFLGVKHVENEWYVKCIQSSNILMGVSEEVYLDLLVFLAQNWKNCFQSTSIKGIPLLKYVAVDGNVSLCSLNEAFNFSQSLLVSSKSCHLSWLIRWNGKFSSKTNLFFLPESTQLALISFSDRRVIVEWLKYQAKVKSVNVHDYARLLIESIDERRLVISYAHFLYHSFNKDYLSESELRSLFKIMPLVDNYGRVKSQNMGVLVPAHKSNWLELIGSNPWRSNGYVELGEDYLHPGIYAGLLTSEFELLRFLKRYEAASDVPDLPPPNCSISSMYSPLIEKNVFLLLEWISNLRRKNLTIPPKFLTSIKEGSWMRISLNGTIGYRPPSQSFLLSSSCGHLLQNGSSLVDIPLVDQGFYGEKFNDYKDELRIIGVMFEYEEACQYIGKHLMSLAASTNLTRESVFSMLRFIKSLSDKYLPPKYFIKTVKEGRWLRTSRGDRSPVGVVLFDEKWRAAAEISDIPFIDQDYYGNDILLYKEELQALGVVTHFNRNYELIVDNLKSSNWVGTLSAEAFLLMLDCLRYLRSSHNVVTNKLRDSKCMKTNMGPKSPAECFLFDPEWGCLLQVFNNFPLVDQSYYGENISSYKKELEVIGVVVDFDKAAKQFFRIFKQRSSSSSVRSKEVLSLLACFRKIKENGYKFDGDVRDCIFKQKWLRTRLGDYRMPADCILFGPEWESISSITLLPFIDDSNNHYGKGIHEFKSELQRMRVTVAFKKGAKFVIAGLYLPQCPESIPPASVYSLLTCIRAQQDAAESLPSDFFMKASRSWLKTYDGYRPPKECLLYTPCWESFLQRQEGPFIDDAFYGADITSFGKELGALGVGVGVDNGVQLIARCLDAHSNFDTICRIYNYLDHFNWELDDENDKNDKKVWIPKGSDKGEWVTPGECVLHDEDNLFGLQLNVLGKYYGKKQLSFFYSSLRVKKHPLLDDYCKLWKDWEDSGHRLSHAECCAFWSFVARNWGLETEKTLSASLFKMPVTLDSDSIVLLCKDDVFIADDLYLKDLLEQSHPQSLFVWIPQASLQPLPRTKLLEIYSKIGVRRLSEAVHKEELSVTGRIGVNIVDRGEFFIVKGLFRVILAFLGDSYLKIEAKKRLDIAKRLLDITIIETVEPIRVRYNLKLSSGEIHSVEACQTIRWETENSNLFMLRMDKSRGRKGMIEYATYYSEVLSKSLLWEHEDHIYQLAELIKMGFLLEFDEAAIDFLLKSKNLQAFLEDEEFLTSASFPSV